MGYSLRLQRFCCCCTLRTGTLVIGTIVLLYTLFLISIIIAMSLDDEKNLVIDNSFIASIGTGAIFLLVGVLLIVGVYKKNNKFMLPWLVLLCLALIILSIIQLKSLCTIFIVHGILLAIVKGLAVGLSLWVYWYCWICVWSHYMELDDRAAMTSPSVKYSPTHVSPVPCSKADVPSV